MMCETFGFYYIFYGMFCIKRADHRLITPSFYMMIFLFLTISVFFLLLIVFDESRRKP